MRRGLILSTSLRSVGYDSDSKTLEVEFAHGGVYEYLRVPDVVYEELMSAMSPGEYFDSRIRDAGFQYRRVH